MWQQYGKPAIFGVLAVLFAASIWQGYILYQQHTALWTWANQTAPRVNELVRTLKEFSDGKTIPPGSKWEDGTKYGFPGRRVLIHPPIEGSGEPPKVDPPKPVDKKAPTKDTNSK